MYNFIHSDCGCDRIDQFILLLKFLLVDRFVSYLGVSVDSVEMNHITKVYYCNMILDITL